MLRSHQDPKSCYLCFVLSTPRGDPRPFTWVWGFRKSGGTGGGTGVYRLGWRLWSWLASCLIDPNRPWALDESCFAPGKKGTSGINMSGSGYPHSSWCAQCGDRSGNPLCSCLCVCVCVCVLPFLKHLFWVLGVWLFMHDVRSFLLGLDSLYLRHSADILCSLFYHLLFSRLVLDSTVLCRLF